MSRLIETFSSPSNIAVIKYWGKKDSKLNTPINSSVSVTLDQNDLRTITTVMASKDFPNDRLWLNGEEVELNGRGQTCIREIRKIAGDRKDPRTGEVVVPKAEWPSYGVHICSVNTFPTGAGLASSASGFACLVAALGKLFAVEEQYEGQLTAIARQGSGSASRSMYGGFVRWNMGVLKDGTDSKAQQIADEKHWPALRAVILVVSDKQKDTSSTSGMQTSIETSPLLRFRADNVVDARLSEIEKAYLSHDFETFGRITMQDSNQFHATCLDTYPPIFYMNDISRTIIRMVHVINDFYGRIKLAYTFDAGPNAVVYCLDEDAKMFMSVVSKYFPATGDISGYCNNVNAFETAIASLTKLPAELIQRLDQTGRVPKAGDVKYVFLTRAGPGPKCLDPSEALLDSSTGLPSAQVGKIRRLQVNSEESVTSSNCCCKSSKIAVSCVLGAVCVALGYFLAGRIEKR